jgi:hypothetical protein
MSTWTRLPQEQEGTYQFGGSFYVTQGVLAILTLEEILSIYLEIQALAEKTGGIDYIQVYANEKGDKLFFIDQCNAEMMAEESFREEFNHCTLICSHEY